MLGETSLGTKTSHVGGTQPEPLNGRNPAHHRKQDTLPSSPRPYPGRGRPTGSPPKTRKHTGPKRGKEDQPLKHIPCHHHNDPGSGRQRTHRKTIGPHEQPRPQRSDVERTGRPTRHAHHVLKGSLLDQPHICPQKHTGIVEAKIGRQRLRPDEETGRCTMTSSPHIHPEGHPQHKVGKCTGDHPSTRRNGRERVIQALNHGHKPLEGAEKLDD